MTSLTDGISRTMMWRTPIDRAVAAAISDSSAIRLRRGGTGAVVAGAEVKASICSAAGASRAAVAVTALLS
jgi:hypothetical protein